MTPKRWDAIVVGHGLAGTTLAWHLKDAGWRVLLIDAGEPVTSSKIAAGLITPITGRRFVLTQGYEKLLPAAKEFYASVEKRSGRRFFHERRSLRLFATEEEQELWLRRRHQPLLQQFLADPQPAVLLDPCLGSASRGGFEMQGAQLDVEAYLGASCAALPRESIRVDWRRDVTIGQDKVEVHGYEARVVISCEGYAAAKNPYFSFIPYLAAKGDILTVRFHEPMPPICIHRGIWVAPTSEPEVFKTGGTYDLTHLDEGPSEAARQDIERKLQEFIRVPYTVLAHRSAIRPIIHTSNAVIGLHPCWDRLGYFNGLGSKGALLAPAVSQCFADFLVRGAPLPNAFNLRTRI